MKKRYLFIPSAILIFIFFLVGTFLDFQFLQGFANINSSFAKAMTGLIVLPVHLIISFVAGTLIKLIVLKRFNRLYQNILLGVFALISLAVVTFLFGREVISPLAFNISNKLLILPIGLLASIPGAIAGFFLFKYVDSKDYLKKIIYLACICVVSLGIIFVFKFIAPRARFSLIISDSNFSSYYRAWYNPSLTKEMVEALKSSYLGNEAYASFPSGHAASGMIILIVLTSLPMFINKLKGKETLLFIIGFVFYLLVCLIRMRTGQHYLTDVTFSGLICLGVYYIGNEINIRKLDLE